MLRNIFRRAASACGRATRTRWLLPRLRPMPSPSPMCVPLATGAALATVVDSSPAVLVSIYDYAHRYRDKGRRTA